MQWCGCFLLVTYNLSVPSCYLLVLEEIFYNQGRVVSSKWSRKLNSWLSPAPRLSKYSSWKGPNAEVLETKTLFICIRLIWAVIFILRTISGSHVIDDKDVFKPETKVKQSLGTFSSAECGQGRVLASYWCFFFPRPLESQGRSPWPSGQRWVKDNLSVKKRAIRW